MRRTRRFLKTGSGIWTPAQLSNQVGWWSASSIAGKSDGDSVTAWPDSYGLLSDATGSGTYRTGANGIGGKPAIEFNGATNNFATGYTGTPTNFFVAGVCTLGSAATFNEMVMDKYYLTGFSVFRHNSNEALALNVRFNNSGNNPLSYTAPAYFMAGRTGSSAILECNTLTRTDSCSSSALSADELYLGSQNTGSGWLEGKIAFALFLDAYPSAEDLANLRSYITSTYGIATS